MKDPEPEPNPNEPPPIGSIDLLHGGTNKKRNVTQINDVTTMRDSSAPTPEDMGIS